MITDRTSDDVSAARVLRAKIQSGESLTDAERLQFERGACTVSMLNRISAETSRLSALINKSGYSTVQVQPTLYDSSQIFGYAEHYKILADIERLRADFYVFEDTPAVPGYMYGYMEANDIERILVDIGRMYDGMVSRYGECDTFYCGEV